MDLREAVSQQRAVVAELWTRMDEDGFEGKAEALGRGLERQAKLVKVATEADLQGLLAQEFALQVGLVQRALRTAVETHIPDEKARRTFLADVQLALAEILDR